MFLNDNMLIVPVLLLAACAALLQYVIISGGGSGDFIMGAATIVLGTACIGQHIRKHRRRARRRL